MEVPTAPGRRGSDTTGYGVHAAFCASSPRTSTVSFSPWVVADVVTGLEASDEPVPEPMATKRYSEKSMVRVPPELHRLLALVAAEAGVILNRLASARNNPGTRWTSSRPIWFRRSASKPIGSAR